MELLRYKVCLNKTPQSACSLAFLEEEFGSSDRGEELGEAEERGWWERPAHVSNLVEEGGEELDPPYSGGAVAGLEEGELVHGCNLIGYVNQGLYQRG